MVAQFWPFVGMVADGKWDARGSYSGSRPSPTVPPMVDLQQSQSLSQPLDGRVKLGVGLPMRHVVDLADRLGCMAQIQFEVAFVLATLLKGVCARLPDHH